MNRISVLIKETPQSSLILLCEDTARRHLFMNLEEGSHQTLSLPALSSQTFLVSRLVRNKLVLYKPPTLVFLLYESERMKAGDTLEKAKTIGAENRLETVKLEAGGGFEGSCQCFISCQMFTYFPKLVELYNKKKMIFTVCNIILQFKIMQRKRRAVSSSVIHREEGSIPCIRLIPVLTQRSLSW